MAKQGRDGETSVCVCVCKTAVVDSIQVHRTQVFAADEWRRARACARVCALLDYHLFTEIWSGWGSSFKGNCQETCFCHTLTLISLPASAHTHTHTHAPTLIFAFFSTPSSTLPMPTVTCGITHTTGVCVQCKDDTLCCQACACVCLWGGLQKEMS